MWVNSKLESGFIFIVGIAQKVQFIIDKRHAHSLVFHVDDIFFLMLNRQTEGYNRLKCGQLDNYLVLR